MRDRKCKRDRKEWHSSRYDATKLAGTCVRCFAAPAEPGKVWCSGCRISTREKRESRRDRGLCIHCGTASPNNARCDRCIVKYNWKSNTGKVAGWLSVYEKLVEQGYRCAYTGDTLILGVNASIDHIKPRSRYPESLCDTDNVQWVTEKINRMKSNLTHEEFLLLISKISEYTTQ